MSEQPSLTPQADNRTHWWAGLRYLGKQFQSASTLCFGVQLQVCRFPDRVSLERYWDRLNRVSEAAALLRSQTVRMTHEWGSDGKEEKEIGFLTGGSEGVGQFYSLAQQAGSLLPLDLHPSCPFLDQGPKLKLRPNGIGVWVGFLFRELVAGSCSAAIEYEADYPTQGCLMARLKIDPFGASALVISGLMAATGAEPAKKLTWQEAASRLENIRRSGEKWPGYDELENRLPCSRSTIHKAINQTPSLRAWMDGPCKVKAQSMNDMVTDNTPNNAPDPSEEAAIREYLENASAEERAFFNGLSGEDQLFFLNDPDKHQKILGRKA